MTRAVVKRRSEFLAGRYCARLSLDQFGIYQKDLPIGKNRNPIWPTGVFGSISHSSTRAVCYTSCHAHIIRLGVDVENIIEEKTAQKIKSQFASQSEIEIIDNILGNKSELLSILFSAKESFFKAAYPSVQKYIGFDAISLTEIDLSNKIYFFKTNRRLAPAISEGTTISACFENISNTEVATIIVLTH